MSEGGIHFREQGDWFHPHFREIIRAMMRAEGRDFNRCELKGEHIPDGEYEIHHTNYEGATYADLRIVCRSCNHAPQNVGLN